MALQQDGIAHLDDFSSAAIMRARKEQRGEDGSQFDYLLRKAVLQALVFSLTAALVTNARWERHLPSSHHTVLSDAMYAADSSHRDGRRHTHMRRVQTTTRGMPAETTKGQRQSRSATREEGETRCGSAASYLARCLIPGDSHQRQAARWL
ncbi:hypothetical protein MRX96_050669 [Rhipicephalus microplus]